MVRRDTGEEASVSSSRAPISTLVPVGTEDVSSGDEGVEPVEDGTQEEEEEEEEALMAKRPKYDAKGKCSTNGRDRVIELKRDYQFPRGLKI